MNVGLGIGLGFGGRVAFPPVISSIDIALSDPRGGDLRTLLGTTLDTATAVSIDGTPVTAFAAISATEMIVVMPALAADASRTLTVTGPGGAGTIEVEYYSPASEALTGYWERGNYDAQLGTWPGLASAGASGGRDLTQSTAGYRPSETNLEPVFDGVDDRLGSSLAVDSFVAGGAGTVFVVYEPASLAAAADNPYDDPALVGIAGQYGLLQVNTDGARASLYDGAYRQATITAPAGTMHAATLKWNGTNGYLSVDGSAFTSFTCSTVLLLSGGALRIGANWDASKKFNGAIRAIALIDTALSDATCAKLLLWARSSHGVAA